MRRGPLVSPSPSLLGLRTPSSFASNTSPRFRCLSPSPFVTVDPFHHSPQGHVYDDPRSPLRGGFLGNLRSRKRVDFNAVRTEPEKGVGVRWDASPFGSEANPERRDPILPFFRRRKVARKGDTRCFAARSVLFASHGTFPHPRSAGKRRETVPFVTSVHPIRAFDRFRPFPRRSLASSGFPVLRLAFAGGTRERGTRRDEDVESFRNGRGGEGDERIPTRFRSEGERGTPGVGNSFATGRVSLVALDPRRVSRPRRWIRPPHERVSGLRDRFATVLVSSSRKRRSTPRIEAGTWFPFSRNVASLSEALPHGPDREIGTPVPIGVLPHGSEGLDPIGMIPHLKIHRVIFSDGFSSLPLFPTRRPAE